MRRAAAFLALATLAAVLVSVGGRTLGQAHAATGTCVVHTRHVVRHVKRHGTRTRIVRPVHYRTCEDAPAPGPPAVPTPASPTAPTPTILPTPAIEVPPIETSAPPQPEPEPNAVGVIADDHALPLTYLASRTQVRPGKLTVQLDNRGDDAHNMLMEKVGPNGEPEGEVIKVSTKTEPGRQTKSTVEVEAGSYRMWCSFENGKHAEEGMETHIVVAE